MEEGEALFVQVGRIAATLIFLEGGKGNAFLLAEERMLLFACWMCKQCQHFFRCDDTKQQIDEKTEGTFDGIIFCLTDKSPSSTVMMRQMMAQFFSLEAPLLEKEFYP